jgi:hypothetical protein
MVTSMDIAVDRAKDNSQELLVLLAPGHGGLTWAFLREYAYLKHGIDAALVQYDRALPLSDKGAVLVGDARNETRDLWFSDGARLSGRARITNLPPAKYFMPDVRALHPFQFSNDIVVYGFYRLDQEVLPRAGERWTIIMIWQSENSVPQDFKLFTHLIDGNGRKYAQADRLGLAADQWRSGGLYASQFDLDLPDDFPETGAMFLSFGLYGGEDQAELLDAAGRSTGSPATIQIRSEGLPAAVWRNGLELLSLEFSSPIQPGPPINISAVWHATQDLPEKPHLHWRVLDQKDFVVYSAVTDVLSNTDYSVWPRGVFAAEKYDLRVPSDIQPGEYRMEVQVVSKEGESFDEQFVTTVEVVPRERDFDVPVMLNAVRANFGGEIEILGYELAQTKSALEIILYWRALAYVSRDYKYFVHLWQGENLVAQVDSMPLDWQYWTSWWAPGEVVRQHVVFDVEAFESEEFGVTTGFYDPDDGERVSVMLPDGSIIESSLVTLIETSDE